MAAKAGDEVVMAPGNLVVSAYVGCPDITQVSVDIGAQVHESSACGCCLHVVLLCLPVLASCVVKAVHDSMGPVGLQG